jgi:hypothetical protein
LATVGFKSSLPQYGDQGFRSITPEFGPLCIDLEGAVSGLVAFADNGDGKEFSAALNDFRDDFLLIRKAEGRDAIFSGGGYLCRVMQAKAEFIFQTDDIAISFPRFISCLHGVPARMLRSPGCSIPTSSTQTFFIA